MPALVPPKHQYVPKSYPLAYLRSSWTNRIRGRRMADYVITSLPLFPIVQALAFENKLVMPCLFSREAHIHAFVIPKNEFIS